MALLTLTANEMMVEFLSVDLLPDLEEDVLYDDVIIVDLEESYTAGLDDWWGGFVSDMYL